MVTVAMGVVFCLCGCRDFAVFATAPSLEDAGALDGARRDGASIDAARDFFLVLEQGGGDLPNSPDAVSTPTDAAVLEAATPDAPGQSDVFVDPDGALPPDAFVWLDTVVPDGPPPPPCSTIAAPLHPPTWAATMVVCESSQGLVDHCTAETLCNLNAWHLCGATEYQLYGGKVDGANAAWLGSCVRDGVLPMAPTDAPCSLCSAATGDTLPLSWVCSGTADTKSTNAAYVGVVAERSCRRVGVDSANAEGFWEYKSVNARVGAAVCCRN